MRAPALTPVTTAKSGRAPRALHPLRRPAPNAPSTPPADSESQGPDDDGPLVCDKAREKSRSDVEKNRTSGKPETIAASSSCALKRRVSSGIFDLDSTRAAAAGCEACCLAGAACAGPRAPAAPPHAISMSAEVRVRWVTFLR